MTFLSSIWDIIWWCLTIFVFIAYLMALFSIISDLFRDHKLNGFAKAAWLLFLIFVPFITALVYLIARGKGMNERSRKQAEAAEAAAAEYIRSAAGTQQSAAQEIAAAKQLLDSGTITEAEFATLKANALNTSTAA